MTYFEFRFKKMLVILLSAIVLGGGVLLTFSFKNMTYGTTPFFNVTRLFFEDKGLYGLFAFQHFVRSGGRALLSATLYFRSENTVHAHGQARAIPVLTYHRLSVSDDGSNVTISNFADQMETLYENGWRTITLADYEAFMQGKTQLPERSFLLTFDDGAQQSFYPTDPILNVLGYHAVEYVIVAASQIPKTTYYLTPEQIRAMLQTGRWEIGSHSYDAHRPYPVDAEGDAGIFYSDKLWLPDKNRIETTQEFTARVANDLALAKRSLEQTYGVAIDTFAFPFGGEIGKQAAQNFPQGEQITIDEASKIYAIGWIQDNDQEFTQNYPPYRTFLNKRIHVDHDYSGTQLLSVMENGLPKPLPWADDMTIDRGWLPSWGEVRIGGVLSLAAVPGESSAETMLDGSLLWQNYDFSAQVNWKAGDARLLAQLTNSKTYRSCVFNDGKVRIQDTTNGHATTITEVANPSVVRGSDVALGIRASGSNILCLYNGSVVAAGSAPPRAGGVGVQTWDQTLGRAALVLTSASVNPL